MACLGALAVADRADLLAVIAAVQAITDRLPELDRNRPRGLHQPGQAAARIDDAGLDDELLRAPAAAAVRRALAGQVVGARVGAAVLAGLRAAPAPGSGCGLWSVAREERG